MAEPAEIPTEDEPLTTQQTKRLTTLETVIGKGLGTFIDVGNALSEIRDSRLYRQQFKSFQEYCETRWDMSRQQAYRLIEAAGVASDLSPNGDTLNEFQARVLVDVEPEHRLEVFQQAKASAPEGRMSAAHLQEKKEEWKAARPAPKPERKKKKDADKKPPSKAVAIKALNHIGSLMGKQFRAMLERGQLITDQWDLVEFSKLDDSQLKETGKLLQQGWGYSDAVSEVASRLSADDRIRLLHSQCVKSGGKLKVRVPPFIHVVVTEDLEKELEARLKGWPK
jgi:hypothetical protein